MALLSIIIPVYNGENYIVNTLNQILSGNFQDFEIIVVNDGSRDRSAQVVGEMQKKDPRIKLYNKENGGVASSRNFGIHKATGKYVCLVDQDDIVKKDMYRQLVNRLEQDGSDMGICSAAYWINGKEFIRDKYEDKLYCGAEVKENLLFPIIFNGYEVPNISYKGNHYPEIWTCIFKRSFLLENNIRFRIYVDYEDDLLVKVESLSKASKVSTVSYAGYLWKVNLASQSNTRRFVPDIGKKKELVYLDLKKSCEAAHLSPETMKLFKQVTYCRQFVKTIDNLYSSKIIKNPKVIKEYFEENIYSRDFSEVIVARKYMKKGQIKAGILLPILEKKLSITCYVVGRVVNKLDYLSKHFAVLLRLARRIKK